MNKRRILAVAMLLAVFSSVFAFGITSTTTQTAVVTNVKATAPEISFETSPEALGDPLGDKGVWAQEANMSLFVADGNLSEWSVNGATLGTVTVWLAYDATHVYVGLSWADATVDSDVSKWNKTGLYNQTEYPGDAMWEFVDGADDVVEVGFHNGTVADLWVWTASNRTADNYALEIDVTGTPDAGTKPFVANSNYTAGQRPKAAINGSAFTGNVKPIRDNSWATIADYTTIPNGTMYNAWKNTTTTPSGSQTDVEVGWMHDGANYYVEMVRALDTGNDDDFVIDFTEALDFHIAVANMDIAADLMLDTTAYSVATTCEDAAISLDPIDATVTESLLVTGEVYDDYDGWSLMIGDTAWEGTWGTAGPAFNVDVTEATGEFSFLMLFDQWDMPTGAHTITLYFTTRYNGTLTASASFTVDDVEAPNIEGLVDVSTRYEDGIVPLSEDYVVVTVGLQDDHDATDDLTVDLYSWKDDDVALAEPMVQFSPGGKTFYANITIEHSDQGIYHNYTYFVQAWDLSLNKATSQQYTFTSAPSVEVITSTTPGFGIIAGLFGAAVAAFIIKKKLE
ncbi:MAG: hypothetical protein GF308_16415 [Candidatus Heimdallarchaeota archaeon]|nr:hypothetical protein [Candidatus Heimdallarchaeota archaeon]